MRATNVCSCCILRKFVEAVVVLKIKWMSDLQKAARNWHRWWRVFSAEAPVPRFFPPFLWRGGLNGDQKGAGGGSQDHFRDQRVGHTMVRTGRSFWPLPVKWRCRRRRDGKIQIGLSAFLIFQTKLLEGNGTTFFASLLFCSWAQMHLNIYHARWEDTLLMAIYSQSWAIHLWPFKIDVCQSD